jgi:hypothetical protein
MHSRGLLFLSIALLTACASTGVINQPPRATSAQSAVDVRIHNLMSGSHVTFIIDDVEIYGFVEPSHYDFVLDAGGYRFGYKKDGRKCHAEVVLNAGVSYIFNLAPDCVIEMQ